MILITLGGERDKHLFKLREKEFPKSTRDVFVQDRAHPSPHEFHGQKFLLTDLQMFSVQNLCLVLFLLVFQLLGFRLDEMLCTKERKKRIEITRRPLVPSLYKGPMGASWQEALRKGHPRESVHAPHLVVALVGVKPARVHVYDVGGDGVQKTSVVGNDQYCCRPFL